MTINVTFFLLEIFNFIRYANYATYDITVITSIFEIADFVAYDKKKQLKSCCTCVKYD